MFSGVRSSVDSAPPYARFSLSGFNAPPQAMTWSSMALTDFSCWAAGLKTLKFSKSVNRESTTWLRTVGDLDLGHHQA